jgi:predicted DsbA family dithiol-disulfide isomerase
VKVIRLMKVEIWSDVVCPWCYIGKRRFEEAMQDFAHRDQIEVVRRSFELDPTMPQEVIETHDEMLAKKFGTSIKQVKAMDARVTQLAAEVGLEYHLADAKPANSFDAHRIIHLAAQHGLEDKAEERFFHAHFVEGLQINDRATLVHLATEIGLDASEVEMALASDSYADDVRTDESLAQQLGITGVPFFVIDEKYGISGAQPTEVFQRTLEQAWNEAHPQSS